jgi:putative redox protein
MAVVMWVEGLKFVATGDSGHSIVLDTSKDSGGRDQGNRPLELLLLGLGGCSGMDVVWILRKQRQNVRGLEIHVTGTRREESPRYYTSIAVEYVVTGHGLSEEKVRRAVELSEQKYCSVYAMLSTKATITSTVKIVEG